MLNYVEQNPALDEEVDIAKAEHTRKDDNEITYKLIITGSNDEIDFMLKHYLRPYSNNVGAFNEKYNQDPNFKFFLPTPDRGNWKKLFWWRARNPEVVPSQLKAIQNFIRDVNIGLAKESGAENPEGTANPKLDAFLMKLEQVTNFIESKVINTLTDVPETKENIERRLEGFVNELARAVDDKELLEKVNNYLAFASVFSYSFLNTFLIYLQNKKAREVLSIGDWRKLNMQPKSDADLTAKYGGAKAIGLWVPTSSGGAPLKAQIWAENKWRKRFGYSPLPLDAKYSDLFYNKKGSNSKLPKPRQMALDKFVRMSLVQYKGVSGFKVMFKFLDQSDVEQIPNEEVVARPEQPQWHTEEEDVLADKIYEAAIQVIQDLGLKFGEIGDEESGGAKGWSTQSGDIKLLATNVGIGRASTAVHELAHALTHQTYLKDLHKVDEKVKNIQEKMRRHEKIQPGEGLTRKERLIYDAYRGRQSKDFMEELFGGNKQILELQAEGVAFIVLRYFGIDENKLKHSSTYIALWKGSKASVSANLEILSQTAKSIISFMKPYMGIGGENLEAQNTEGFDDTGEQELEEEEILSFLYEMSIFETNKVLTEAMKLKKDLLNGIRTEN